MLEGPVKPCECEFPESACLCFLGKDLDMHFCTETFADPLGNHETHEKLVLVGGNGSKLLRLM